MTSEKINIAIVDDHTLFRQGLAKLLSESNEVNVLFDADNGADMIKKLCDNQLPEVILMDITMPVMDGYETTRWLKENYPDINVLALSMFEEDKPIIGMLKSGAGGYMLKQSRTGDLISAIKGIAKHSFYINELVSGKLLRNIQNNQPVKTAAIELNKNEQKFLELCCSDYTYKQIADMMNLSPHTIDNYREALFQKFDVKSRTGLVISALKSELIKL
ncbi:MULTISPECIES: response regulator transcription factor [unclassified Mucilaginibacter]|uniref:response regulator transcription factor n=1 Tax=unclassified Mucilaginibacter TaxID=2617802 RepID=UPI0009624CA0|nr:MULTISPECIES: response regulator transcription factor [unclassified Mucilaginibacter]OJW18251.1 MAG: DNA-binding response regulator [Mucilaginibacter sp. 44-25]PLW88965.1 MAG: DNA-binding response regulator [Mucilaginibacter sp.]PMP66110.1 MAG: DNA-binding response regulator [Mucilaginibacter sp.]HEK19882.1 response regulator transcription factor [Bacteroidota bacterium]